MALEITETAAAEFKKLAEEHPEQPAPAVRIKVAGGGCGCGSVHFGMQWESNPETVDEFVDGDGFRICIDPESNKALTEASVDYINEPMRHGFTIRVPSEGGGCGCQG